MKLSTIAGPAAGNRGARKRRPRGFTLLEVLVAVAILGLGLTIVLSSQTGIFWSYARARHLSQAPGLLRCKMSEIEIELLQMGFPLLDEADDGPCCGDEDVAEYTCDWKILKVTLPELPTEDPFASADAGAGAGLGDGAGALGALAGIQASGGAELGEGATVGGLSEMLGGGGGMMGGMGPMVMGLIYPQLKPMLEASIRKVVVTVRWKEGENTRDLSVTQYVTSPQQGGFDPAAADGLTDPAAEATGDSPLSLPGLGGMSGAAE